MAVPKLPTAISDDQSICYILHKLTMYRELTISVPHFLLASSHVSEVIDDRLGQVLQLLQLNFHWLQLLRLSYLHNTMHKNSILTLYSYVIHSHTERLG